MTCIISPTISILNQSDTTDGPTIIHNYYPKSKVVLAFNHHVDILWVLTIIIAPFRIVLLSQTSSVPAVIPPSPQSLATTDIVTVSIVLAFLECHVVGIT